MGFTRYVTTHVIVALLLQGINLVYSLTDPVLLDHTTGRLGNWVEDVTGWRLGGRAEVFIGDEWGRVCDENWDDVDASVLCKQIGLGAGVMSTTGTEGSGKIWIRDIDCAGTEEKLQDCAIAELGPSSCTATGQTMTAGGDTIRIANLFCELSSVIDQPVGAYFIVPPEYSDEAPTGKWQMDTCLTLSKNDFAEYRNVCIVETVDQTETAMPIQSSDNNGTTAAEAIDNDLRTCATTNKVANEKSYWYVDLGETKTIRSITIQGNSGPVSRVANGRTAIRRAIACEGNTLQITCETGSTIRILSALFGRTKEYVEECYTTTGNSTAACDTDVPEGEDLGIMKAACNGQETCNVTAHRATFDPSNMQGCSFTSRYLEVTYRCLQCPSGYHRIGESCYQRHMEGSLFGWKEAKTACTNLGGYILNIDDQEESDAIYEYYKNETWPTNRGFILGGRFPDCLADNLDYTGAAFHDDCINWDTVTGSFVRGQNDMDNGETYVLPDDTLGDAENYCRMSTTGTQPNGFTRHWCCLNTDCSDRRECNSVEVCTDLFGTDFVPLYNNSGRFPDLALHGTYIVQQGTNKEQEFFFWGNNQPSHEIGACLVTAFNWQWSTWEPFSWNDVRCDLDSAAATQGQLLCEYNWEPAVDITISVTESLDTNDLVSTQTCSSITNYNGDYAEITCDPPIQGRYVVVYTDSDEQQLEICEFEVFIVEPMVVIRDYSECLEWPPVCTDPTKICLETPGSYSCDTNECAFGNGGCAQICNNILDGYNCSCVDGYSLIAGHDCQDSDECEENAHNCDDTTQDCVNTIGSFKCVCKSGWKGNGMTCTNIDECATGTHLCASNANCTDTEGSYNCTCHTGYESIGDVEGIQCVDIDECSDSPCDFGCINTPGSFLCTCDTGYELLNATHCQDINECLDNNGGCSHNCTNIDGSFSCACPFGWIVGVDGITCEDIDECRVGNGGCWHDCRNTIGSFYCECELGYLLGDNGFMCLLINEDLLMNDTNNPCARALCGYGDCQVLEDTYQCDCFPGFDGPFCIMDIDECESGNHTCDLNADCSNTIGNYTCQCKPGYFGDGYSCTNIDECSSGTHNCHSWANCTDTVGSFSCTCQQGFQGDGVRCKDINECDSADPSVNSCDPNSECFNMYGSYYCTCKPGSLGGYVGDGETCRNVDECAEGLHNCHPDATCTDSPGSFNCTCNEGFTGDGHNCIDVDECDTGDFSCDQNAECVNTAGSYKCECNAGYRKNSAACDNIDECSELSHNCDGEAECLDTDGSFMCVCNEGFTGDGVQCRDVNECSGSNACDANAKCNNNNGNYTCQCNEGFEGDGNSCTNIDECSRGLHNCHSWATCTDDVGGFSCACNAGWTGDGVTCNEIDECLDGTALCEHNCDNPHGSYECSCNSGYELNDDKITCSDIDECDRSLDNCEHTCVNTQGSFNCTCNEGFTLGHDGHCTKKPTVIVIFFGYLGIFPPGLRNRRSSVYGRTRRRIEAATVNQCPLCGTYGLKKHDFSFSEGSILGQLTLTFATDLSIAEESKVSSQIGDLFMTNPVLIPDDGTNQTVMEAPLYLSNQGDLASIPITIQDACFLFKATTYCQRGSVCDITPENTPYCRCQEGFTGDQCDEEVSQVVSLSDMTLIAAIGVLTVLGISSCFLFYCFVKGKWRRNRYEYERMRRHIYYLYWDLRGRSLRPGYTVTLKDGQRGESSDYRTRPVPLPHGNPPHSMDRLPRRTRDPFAPNKLQQTRDPFLDDTDELGKKRLRRFPDSYTDFVHSKDRPKRLSRYSDSVDESTQHGPKKLSRYDPSDLPPIPLSNRLTRYDPDTFETMRFMDPLMVYGTHSKRRGKYQPPNYSDLYPRISSGSRTPKRLPRSGDLSPPPMPGQPADRMPSFRGVTRMSQHADPLSTDQPMYMGVAENGFNSVA